MSDGDYRVPDLYLREKKFVAPAARGNKGFVPVFVGRAIKGFANIPLTINNWEEFLQFYGGLHKDYNLGYEVQNFFKEGGNSCKVVRILKTSGSVGVAVTADKTFQDSIPADSIIVSALNEGAWGNNVKITIADALQPSASTFRIIVSYNDIIVEIFDDITLDDTSPRWLEAVINRYDSDGNLVNDSGSLYISVSALKATDKPANISDVVLVNGADGDAPVESDYIGTDEADTGLYCLDNYNDFDAISVVEIFTQNMAYEGIKYCSHRLDCVYLVNAPKDYTDVEIKTMALALKSASYQHPNNLPDDTCASFGWFAHPWVVISDELGKGLRPLKTIPNAGYVAAQWNFSMLTIGAWQSAAGPEFGKADVIVKPERVVSNLADLNDVGVNVIRVFGNVLCIMGARTLSKDRDYRYCTTRLLLKTIQREIVVNNRGMAFKPNNATTYSLISDSMKDTLNKYFKSGAFQGEAEEAYFYKCDEEINTNATRKKGQIWAQAGISPVEPGEFLIFEIGLFANGDVVIK